MPNRIVDVVDALNAGVASGEDFFVTVIDDGGGTGTFARDNWESLPPFCYSRDRPAFIIRRFEADQPDIRFVDARDVFPMLDLGTRREARLLPGKGFDSAYVSSLPQPSPRQSFGRWNH
jgi:hypothetical protein